MGIYEIICGKFSIRTKEDIDGVVIACIVLIVIKKR